jgi:hypothetical protein
MSIRVEKINLLRFEYIIYNINSINLYGLYACMYAITLSMYYVVHPHGITPTYRSTFHVVAIK